MEFLVSEWVFLEQEEVVWLFGDSFFLERERVRVAVSPGCFKAAAV